MGCELQPLEDAVIMRGRVSHHDRGDGALPGHGNGQGRVWASGLGRTCAWRAQPSVIRARRSYWVMGAASSHCRHCLKCRAGRDAEARGKGCPAERLRGGWPNEAGGVSTLMMRMQGLF